MYHQKPKNRKEIKETGLIESTYDIKNLKTIDLTEHTIPGGRMDIKAVGYERLLIVKKGLGEIEIGGKSLTLKEGVVLEIPKGTSGEIHHSVLEFYCISAK